VVPLLAADPRVGQVIAVDLPGHGALQHVKPAADIGLDDYVEHVAGLIEARDLEDVVIVGHSLAGLTLPPVAHRVEARLRRLIYLASSNPDKGRTVNDLMDHPLSPIRRGVSMETMFCNDLDADSSEWLMSQLVDEPPRLLETPVEVPRGPSGVPSTYILLERDETLPPEYQREQAQTAGVDEVVSFDTGHSAFAAKPRELAKLLLRYA
jgi:pimeloyl-ACP methyl ester carboxylesterase